MGYFSRATLFLFLLVILSSCAAFSGDSSSDPYDIVIKNGRVMDPETGRDERGLNVAIRDGRIVKITQRDIKGLKTIEANGRVVSPGFIDLLSYDPNSYGVWYKVADGVTTNLAMHGGAVDVRAWYDIYESRGNMPINFGAGFFYNGARLQLGIGRNIRASKAQIKKLIEMAEQALSDGAPGIGMSMEYAPGTTTDEITAMMRVAADHNVPVFFHIRHSDMEKPGTNIDALNEVITLARETGAAIHIDHINSTGGTFSMQESLKLLEDARADGVDVTACTYPYSYWATYLNSARFSKGWQKRFRIGYGDLQLGGSTERLTKSSFYKYKKLGKLAVAYAMPEDDITGALRSPFVMIGSDGILETSLNNHPRGAGAFARTIAVYVRERGELTLMEALRKMTIMPAKRLEASVPMLKRKGRLQRGADADILIFDPEKIRDTATVEKPNGYSEGMDYVLVAGKVIKDPIGFYKEEFPGRAIKAVFD